MNDLNFTSDANPISADRSYPRPGGEIPFQSTSPARPPVSLLPVSEHLGMAQEAAHDGDIVEVLANILNALECETERALREWETGNQIEALRNVGRTCRTCERIIQEAYG